MKVKDVSKAKGELEQYDSLLEFVGMNTFLKQLSYEGCFNLHDHLIRKLTFFVDCIVSQSHFSFSVITRT